MKREIYAYSGKILRVDLSTGVIHTQQTIEYAKEWLGGRGIGQRILYTELQPWVTPFEPANILVVETGPLCGTLAPAATRHSLASKNTFNNGVGTSNSGGHFAPELKFAGYDFIVFHGKASLPVYLWIDDEHVELRDARGIWGKTTWETDDLIKEGLGDEQIQIMCIGPAGENLVRGACVISNRNRAAGRCGLGAVMGSKNLKAVAVRGTGPVEVAHPDRFMKAVDDAWKKLVKLPIAQVFAKYGTQFAFVQKNDLGHMPYKNFQDGYMPPEALKKVHPEVMTNYKVRDIGYTACPIHCSHFYRVDNGPYAGLATEGLETEVMADFAGKLAIDYAPAIIKAHALCNQLGLDVDNATGPISWAFECYQRGIITQKDTDGLKLQWGDHVVILELVRKIAYREGFGNILAEGCKRASEMLGRDSEYYAIHMKGQDLYEDIRMPIGWSFGVCVATRGGGHTTGSTAAELFAAGNAEVAEIGNRVYGIKTLGDPIAYEDKHKIIIFTERYQEIMNSLGMCMHMGMWMLPLSLTMGELGELYSAATGWETTEDKLVWFADRILNLEKAFNGLHTNLSRKDDYPHQRFLTEPIKSGPYKGFVLSQEKYSRMLDEYYKLRHWDEDTGLQTRKCLEDLDLADVADDLEKAHKLINK